jgi:hypothetical protein
LHHEEFTWPRLSPAAPVSSYLTVSPIASEDFKFEISNLKFISKAGIFSVALVVIPHRDARTLSGSLPYGVRTFLFPNMSGKRLPGLLHCEAVTV